MTSVLKIMHARVALLLMLGLVLVSVLLPNTGIAWMRSHWPWFNWPMLWIERINSAVNLVHGVLFLLLGMTAALALPRWRVARVLTSMLVLGVVTEVAQLVVPGRNPRVADVIVDAIAGVLGWGAVWLSVAAFETARRRRIVG